MLKAVFTYHFRVIVCIALACCGMQAAYGRSAEVKNNAERKIVFNSAPTFKATVAVPEQENDEIALGSSIQSTNAVEVRKHVTGVSLFVSDLQHYLLKKRKCVVLCRTDFHTSYLPHLYPSHNFW